MSNGKPFEAKVDAVITMVDGQPQVSPDPIRVKRQGEVNWTCAEGEWEIEMEERGPLTKGQKLSGARGEKAGDQVLDNAHETGKGGDPGSPRGRHKYVVRVNDGNGWKERDPDVVVGPTRVP